MEIIEEGIGDYAPHSGLSAKNLQSTLQMALKILSAIRGTRQRIGGIIPALFYKVVFKS